MTITKYNLDREIEEISQRICCGANGVATGSAAAAGGAIAQSAVELGEKVFPTSRAGDKRRASYAGDCEDGSVRQRQGDGEWKTIAHDTHITWPDTSAVAASGDLTKGYWAFSCAAVPTAL